MIDLFISKVLSIFFPPSCTYCKKEGMPLCQNCVQRFHRSLDTPHIFIHSTFSFKDPRVKKLIHTIKYYHRKDLVIPLAEVLACDMKKENISTSAVLIPIPIPYRRLSMRGYNQAEEIANVLSKELVLPLATNILMRNGTTKRQVETKTRSERLSNQKNSFTVTENVHGLDIILVDDVTTTGATIVEARKLLLKHGAKSVQAVTLAH